MDKKVGSTYSNSPKLSKGALIKLSEGLAGINYEVINFQYNPESISRSLRSSVSSSKSRPGKSEETTAEPFDPGESFNLTLELDAIDALPAIKGEQRGEITGAAECIAAMELLLYPVEEGQNASKGGSGKTASRKDVPIVLFVWGPDRIVPVRLTSFSVDEKSFLPTLIPVRATVTVGLQVLSEQTMIEIGKKNSSCEKQAMAAYKHTKDRKASLARAYLNSADQTVVGLLKELK